jgi:D-3-phosphoglycerate dehydrogenase
MKILIAGTRSIPPMALAILESFGDVDATDGTRKDLLDKIPDARALYTLLGDTIDSEVLDCAPHLRTIATPTTGLNHIDLSAAQNKGIKVLSLRGEVDFLQQITATAELTWSLILALTRHLIPATQAVKEGTWDRNLFVGGELNGKTIGIVGYGRLGKIVAQYASAFRMRVLANDIRQVHAESGVISTDLGTLLGESDIVSLHIPYNQQTHGFFDLKKFRQMKRGAMFINTSRGEIVDEYALTDALTSGHIASAGLDVLSGETSLEADWLQRHPLSALMGRQSNLLVTPHIGGATHESMEKTCCFVANKLKEEFLSHQTTSPD